MCTRCEELEEEVRQLKSELYNQDWQPPCELRLTRMQATVLQALMRSSERPMSKEYLVMATRISCAKKDDPDPKLIDAVICKMRAILRPYDLWIETIHSRGYRVTPETRHRLLNWQTERAAA